MYFSYILGVSPSSEGIACAATAGISESILLRAQSIKKSILEKKPIRPIAMKRFKILENPTIRRLISVFLDIRDWKHYLSNNNTNINNNNNNNNANNENVNHNTSSNLLYELKNIIKFQI